uniref:PSI domain-containing protein n=1 Tax=Pyramimonas obovata TaxID=1411642 RepID=A0A7S0NA25_9CHLO|mmetsp:Transcript_23640/g.51602  ORF Transcript_23640/g.51602 Transcript_23640/m.51602 type:complete len:221 (+) Transcript_23640:50-712(+)|eukprot:CAMPEP_0118935200 /NCGR_PEP_ID=MMETSP1169-20130426/15141_1 /TAXON_ID=36882 /ORGANISM="Pyramimonas obovata, Strain CCMP722" /LENGTH=220 /DNA_ID=CAMNT_0006878197 /DNA_START=48 /DNA_END=710 /DNA_ORIENTATION=+
MRTQLVFACAVVAVSACLTQALPVADMRANIESPFAMLDLDTVKHCTRARTDEACNAAHGCTWCEAEGLPSLCFSEHDVAALPPTKGYSCQQRVHERADAQRNPFPDKCMAFTDKGQSKCDMIPGCTWCACSAVPSECLTKENAAKLPKAVFTCDGLQSAANESPMDCVTSQKKDDCTANSECSWCSSSLSSSLSFCSPKDEAKSLNSTLHWMKYTCSNI